MANHRAGKACHKACIRQDKQAKLGMQTSLMRNYFKEPPKESQPIHSTVASPLLLVSACPPAGLPTHLPAHPLAHQTTYLLAHPLTHFLASASTPPPTHEAG